MRDWLSKSMREALIVLLVLLFALPASATTSTINPLSPSTRDTMTATLFRSQFAAAYNDINSLWSVVSVMGGAATLAGDCTWSGSGTLNITCTKTNGIAFGSAATQNSSAFLQASGNLSTLTNPATALTNLGGTTVGTALFTAATATGARTTLGAGAVGDQLFTAATATGAQTALGAGAVGGQMFSASTATGARAALGAGAVGDQVFTAATAAAARLSLFPMRLIASGTTDTATGADFYVKWNSASAATKYETIPTCNSALGAAKLVLIDGYGNSGAYPIVVSITGGTIAKSTSSVVFSSPFGSMTLVCDAVSDWSVIQ